MKTVLVFGTFDHLHPGHEYAFSEAKKCGDRLFVLVARDVTVEGIKGRKPDQHEDERLRNVALNPIVDTAILGDTGNYFAFLDDVVPDVICLGYDQWHNVDELEKLIAKRKLPITIVRLHAHKPNQYKSSLLRKGA